MAVYRKGEDQFGLRQRAEEQKAQSRGEYNEAQSNGYIVGLNPDLTVNEVMKNLGGNSESGFPVSGGGIARGKETLHWKKQNPQVWKNAGFKVED